jgi:hypothetical protein
MESAKQMAGQQFRFENNAVPARGGPLPQS